jgi:hypothetical protein
MWMCRCTPMCFGPGWKHGPTSTIIQKGES